MTITSERIAATLKSIAVRPQPTDFLAVGSIQVAGEPVTWEERISFERGVFQTYTRLRSPVDAGGVSIGSWSAPADDGRTQLLAQALCEVAVWRRRSAAELVPGMDVFGLSVITRDGVLDLTLDAMAPEMAELAAVDRVLRDLAESLESAGQGASLSLQLQVQSVGAQLEAQVWLVNEARRACLIVNPFVTPESTGAELRIETASLPAEIPGITSPPPAFESAPLDLAELPLPWQDPYILLIPRAPLLVPVVARVGPFQGQPHLVRVSYSNYGMLGRMAGVTVIRGKAFSNEVEIG